MRVPVRITHAKAKPVEETREDLLAQELSAHYKVARAKRFSYRDDAGQAKDFVAQIALPEHAMIVEIRGKQDTRGIMDEILREKVTRAQGWGVCLLSDTDVRGDMESALYRVRIAIERAGPVKSRK